MVPHPLFPIDDSARRGKISKRAVDSLVPGSRGSFLWDTRSFRNWREDNTVLRSRLPQSVPHRWPRISDTEVYNRPARSGRFSPKAACHTLVSWTARFAVPFHFAGSRDAAERSAQYFLFSCAKRHWERGGSFLIEVEGVDWGHKREQPYPGRSVRPGNG